MKLLVTMGLVFSLSASAMADNYVRDCGPGYGPDENNLIAILDDEGGPEVLLMGYQIMGTFFEMNVRGCKSMYTRKNDLYCDQLKVGVITQRYVQGEDLGYNGPQGRIKLDPRRYDLSGSCARYKRQPLTITIK